MLRPFIASMLEQAVTSPEDPLLAGEGTSIPEGDRCESIFGLYAAGVPLGDIAQLLACSVLTVQDDIEQARGRRPVLASHDERVAWELHRAVVDKLRDDGGPVLAAARAHLEALRDVLTAEVFTEWTRRLDGDEESLIDAMLAPGERGIQLRRTSPFANSLTSDERLAAVRKAAVPAPL